MKLVRMSRADVEDCFVGRDLGEDLLEYASVFGVDGVFAGVSGAPCLVGILDVHGVDEQVLVADLDEDCGFLIDGFIDERGDCFVAAGRLDLVEPRSEGVDLIGVNETNAELDHGAMMARVSPMFEDRLTALAVGSTPFDLVRTNEQLAWRLAVTVAAASRVHRGVADQKLRALRRSHPTDIYTSISPGPDQKCVVRVIA